MYALVVRFDLRDPASAEAFDVLVADTVRQIRDLEPGTLSYVTHRVEGEPLARLFYEVYEDRAAFDAHEAQPHTVRFLTERDRFIVTTRVEFLTPTSGKALPGHD
ncbi:antibiotic biosynthesis monooxygenase [Nocardia sp. NPDC005366]|uniref:putative quinol monooxygenase n=1 Tax=Nocardia sp. NPDC005366 TaxID=3156878 RepID=UPI0033B1BF5A